MICEALDDFPVAGAVAPLLHLAQEVARLLTGAPFCLLRAFAVARERGAAVAAEGAADQRAGAVAETAGQRVRLIWGIFRRASGGEQQRADPKNGGARKGSYQRCGQTWSMAPATVGQGLVWRTVLAPLQPFAFLQQAVACAQSPPQPLVPFWGDAQQPAGASVAL